MVVTQDKPLASVFRQVGTGSFPPVVEMFERGKTIFSRDPAEHFSKALLSFLGFMRLGKKLLWHCCEK